MAKFAIFPIISKLKIEDTQGTEYLIASSERDSKYYIRSLQSTGKEQDLFITNLGEYELGSIY